MEENSPPARPAGSGRTLARLARNRRLLAAGSFAGGLFAVTGAQWWIVAQARPRIFTDLAAVPSRPVAIVFGAGLDPQGQPSLVLRARVTAAVDLYKAGKVRKLLMSGDNGRVDYDEVTAMKRAAVSHGVPARDVVRDYAGFRTFDTCYRARAVFQVDRAILVTQEYHLPRALFTARKLGIDAVGYVAAPDVPSSTLARYGIRESLAVLTALLDTVLPDRKPRFLGRPEPLFANEGPER